MKLRSKAEVRPLCTKAHDRVAWVVIDRRRMKALTLRFSEMRKLWSMRSRVPVPPNVLAMCFDSIGRQNVDIVLFLCSSRL